MKDFPSLYYRPTMAGKGETKMTERKYNKPVSCPKKAVTTADVYEKVNQKIIEKLEAGYIPWLKPWAETVSYNRFERNSNKVYSLCNQFILDKGGEYATFAQWTEAGFKINKGAKAEYVVFWKQYFKANSEYTGKAVSLEEYQNASNKKAFADENGKLPFRFIPVLKYYPVFNVADVTDKDGKPAEPVREYGKACKYPENVTIKSAETVITNYVRESGVKLEKRQSNSAFYTPSLDTVTLPLLEQFKSVAEYYSTAFHELTHSTGHPSRLNRNLSGTFGKSDSYSKEELTAEMGSCYICSTLGIDTTESVTNTSAYIQSWLKALKNDKTMFVNACGKAEKACEYIMGFTPADELEAIRNEQEQPEQPEKKETKKTKKTGKKEGKKAEKPSLPELGKDAQKALVTLSKKRMSSAYITDGENVITGDVYMLCSFKANRIDSETKALLTATTTFKNEDRQAGSYVQIFTDVERQYLNAKENFVNMGDFITTGLGKDVDTIQPKSATHCYSLERIKLAKRIAGKDAVMKEFADEKILKPAIITGNGVEILICPCRKFD